MADDRISPSSREPDPEFDSENLIRSVVAVPLLRDIEKDEAAPRYVIVDMNTRYEGGRNAARDRVFQMIGDAIRQAGDPSVPQSVHESKSKASQQYVYARLQGKVIRKLVEMDQSTDGFHQPKRSIFHIWPDFIIRPQIWKSVPTVKADACLRAFSTSGKGILWAVLDSGIDGAHPHFAKHANLKDLPAPLQHMDFTTDPPQAIPPEKLTDSYGHGTHVAGIIAGEIDAAVAIFRERDPAGKISYIAQTIPCLSGIAPQCKLISFKVITGEAGDPVSNVIAAIEKIQEINGYGRDIIIHGVNLSLGYPFDAEWFACGQSPVCVEVDRLVKSGVFVVVAAGNTGKGFSLTINDPGNAELAITVGSTHREMPHTYGVSYFSSKGPTGDGRRKPDLIAPGERIVSCGAGPDLQTYKNKAHLTGDPAACYIERSGTSMAAPHVSGMIAGLLSVRTEFIGKPDRIKQVLLENATDLGRDAGFQGRGLADMMRAIQAL